MYKLNPQCITCILNKFINNMPEYASEDIKTDYMKGVLKILSSYDNTITPPEIIAEITDYKNSLFGFGDDFSDVKKHFNKLMLSYETIYSDNIRNSKDSLKTALKFAMLGNYIDFGALDSVDETKLLNIPKESENLHIDKKEYSSLLSDLKSAKKLVYLTDNCGEIVMDKLLIMEIKYLFPQINITVIVKGAPVLNDATMIDAKYIGLDKIVTVIHNGNNIAGTVLSKSSIEAKSIIDKADLIIAKGQANFETLNGFDKNIYYLFLCKCSLYSTRFNVPQFTGLLLNEKRMYQKY